MICPFLLAALIVSPELHPDRRVTFRLPAPSASEVKLWGEWIPKYNTTESMQKNSDGTWSATVGPLAQNLYSYIFIVDGAVVPDPANPNAFVGRDGYAGNLLDIPGPSPGLYHSRPVAHGVLHRHSYSSSIGLGERNMLVYTPPGYNGNARRAYPVLYLIHGSGDTERSWTDPGRADAIADNLFAAGQLRPLIIVMPDGHAPGPNDIKQVEQELLRDVIPLVESQYRTIRRRSARAIAGSSKGGFQALWYGLDHPELFGGIGVMAGGVVDEKGDEQVARFVEKKLPVDPFWVAIGSRDINLPFARRLDQSLTRHAVGHDFVIAPDSGHTWPFWRQALADLLPRLFPALDANRRERQLLPVSPD